VGQNWAFRSSTTKDQTATGGTTLTMTKPTGVADGDLLVAGTQSNVADTQTGPSGWTNDDSRSGGVGTLKAVLWYKVASGEGASWDWTVGTGGNLWLGYVAAYTGIQSTPADVASGQTSNGSTSTAPSVTTTVTDDLDARQYENWSNNSITLDASLTQRVNFGSNGSQIALGDRDQATAAATGALNATLGANTEWTGQTGTFKQTAALPPGLGPVVHMLQPAQAQADAALWRY
jgi:hypothetical protein